MSGFDALEFKPHPHGVGIIARHYFDNGYGVSVVRNTINGMPASYGSEDGLYELGVLCDGSLCYDTPITDDVIGYLTPVMITEIMESVERLPRPGAVA